MTGNSDGYIFIRQWVSAPGTLASCDPFGGWRCAKDFRWETDEEFRTRIKKTIAEDKVTS